MEDVYVGEQTVIAGIHCDLEIENGMSHCYLNQGAYSGTLEFLKAYGYLEDCNGQPFVVTPRIQNLIEEWAENNGY